MTIQEKSEGNISVLSRVRPVNILNNQEGRIVATADTHVYSRSASQLLLEPDF